MTMNKLIIAVDFDGTLVRHEYPRIGEEVPGAIDTLSWLQENGAKLILHTMRCGEPLAEAITWCEERGINFWAVNDNPGQKHWTESRKIYATQYIDDASIGCPLLYPEEGGRPYVDWEMVRQWFVRPGGVA